MKNLAWLLPCWVWKYCFAQLPRERVLLDGRTRFLIRLDEEFALVYDPQGKAMLPKLYPSESKDPRYRANSSFRTFEKPRPCPARSGGSKFLRTSGLQNRSGVGTQGD